MQKVAQKNVFCYIIHVNKKLQLHVVHIAHVPECRGTRAVVHV